MSAGRWVIGISEPVPAACPGLLMGMEDVFALYWIEGARPDGRVSIAATLALREHHPATLPVAPVERDRLAPCLARHREAIRAAIVALEGRAETVVALDAPAVETAGHAPASSGRAWLAAAARRHAVVREGADALRRRAEDLVDRVGALVLASRFVPHGAGGDLCLLHATEDARSVASALGQRSFGPFPPYSFTGLAGLAADTARADA